jgi:hypothetical protein
VQDGIGGINRYNSRCLTPHLNEKADRSLQIDQIFFENRERSESLSDSYKLGLLYKDAAVVNDKEATYRHPATGPGAGPKP